MRTGNMTGWRSLEGWSAMAFGIAGVLWLADTLLLALELMDVYAHGLLNGVFILTALLATVIGLFGFYPKLTDRIPRLALATAIVGAVAIAGLVVTLVWVFGTVVLATLSSPPSAFFLGGYVLSFLVIGLFGILGLWTDVPSRTIGLLLVAYLVILIGGVMASNALQLGLVALVSLLALTIGYVHDTESVEPDRTESPADSTA